MSSIDSTSSRSSAEQRGGIGFEKEDARDVVQEAFIVALVKLDPSKNPKAWLIQVVDHLAVNFQRKLVRRAKLVTKWSPSESRMAVREDQWEGPEGYGETEPQGGDHSS